MEDKMLTLQQLADITWKSVRTLRRVVKDSDKIKTDYKKTKLVASLDDVLKHYWIANPNSYPKDNQPASHDSQHPKLNIEEDSQVVNHQANQEFIQSINSLVQQISEVSKENTELQKSLVVKEQGFWSQLLQLEHKYQKENLSLEREHDQEIKLVKNQQIKRNALARLAIYILLSILVFLTVDYFGLSYRRLFEF
jgi:hypothetical protein